MKVHSVRTWDRLGWVWSSEIRKKRAYIFSMWREGERTYVWVSTGSWHFFPHGGRKWRACCKYLEDEGSKDCLHCSFWTIGCPPLHHAECSQPLRNMTHQNLISTSPWQVSRPTSPLTNGELSFGEGQQLCQCHTDILVHQSGDANSSDFWMQIGGVKDAVVGG